jgi:hypothetical protein
MIATKEPTKNPNSGVIHVEWAQKQTLLCKVGKHYDWGFGFSPIRQYDELFPKGAKMLRVNAQNAKRFESELATGKHWIVSSTGYHFKEGDMAESRLIVHVEGRLLREATEAEVKKEKLLAELADEERLLEKLPERKRSENKRYNVEIPAQNTVWKVDKLLKYKDRDGNDVFGYKLERKDEAIFADVLPEKQKVFRLEAKSVPVKVGQRWNVSVSGLHYTEEYLVDENGTEKLVEEKTQAIYVEGELVSEAKAEVKKEFVQRRKTDEKHFFAGIEKVDIDDYPLEKERRRHSTKKSFERDGDVFSKESSTLREKIDKLELKKFREDMRLEHNMFDE